MERWMGQWTKALIELHFATKSCVIDLGKAVQIQFSVYLHLLVR